MTIYIESGEKMATNKKNGNRKNKKETSVKNAEVEKEISKQEPERQIKLKNYLILGLIFILTLFVVIALRKWYISYENYQLTIPVLKGKLNEVTVAELDNYLTENDDAIVYIEVSEDANSREVAEGLIDVVKKRELTERVVYLNISSIEDKDKFFKDFSSKYIQSEKLEYYPALVLFYEGKVEAFVSRTKNQSLNIGNIEQLFDEYELEG